jgi:hypothetical protein
MPDASGSMPPGSPEPDDLAFPASRPATAPIGIPIAGRPKGAAARPAVTWVPSQADDLLPSDVASPVADRRAAPLLVSGQPRRRRKSWNPWWHHVRCESETSWFLLASLADFGMTYFLLFHGGFRESNPVALYFLNHWGPRGLLYFKCSLMAVVCVVTQLIATQRPKTAAAILRLGTLVVGGVVAYSLVLYLKHGGPPAAMMD